MTKLEIYAIAVENFTTIVHSNRSDVRRFTETLDLDCSSHTDCTLDCPLCDNNGCTLTALKANGNTPPFADKELLALNLLHKASK